MARYGIPQISTGDILRAIKSDPVEAQTPKASMAKDLMEQGLLVPDELVNELVANRLTEPDTRRGYILDGYPRTLNQAEWIDTHLSAAHTSLPWSRSVSSSTTSNSSTASPAVESHPPDASTISTAIRRRSPASVTSTVQHSSSGRTTRKLSSSNA